MKNLLIIIAFLTLIIPANAQSVEQWVLSPSGSSGSGSWGILSYTFGDVVIATGFNFSSMATQGFHQPLKEDGVGFFVENNNKESFLQLYPNPAFDVINIQTSHVVGNVELYNSIGQLLYSNEVIPLQIDVSSYETGLYYLKITSGKSQLTSSVLIH